MRGGGGAARLSVMAITPPRSLLPRAMRSPRLEPDSYFTDGRRLLRVVEVSAGTACTSLEDCLTLEVRSYSPGQLADLSLRLVARPARA